MAKRVFRLSVEEAQVLQTILVNIGGAPDKSPRGIADQIHERLIVTFGTLSELKAEGDIWFQETKEAV